jgi:hypothetical protein
MKPPIVIDENGDVSVFLSNYAAERKLEVIDVLNSEYVGIDGDGVPLNIRAINGKVVISLKDERAQPERLRSLLINFLSAIEPKEWEKLSTSDLLMHAMKYPTI